MAGLSIGKLVGNTGDPSNLLMVMNSSFACRRGEFVRITHQEREGEDEWYFHEFSEKSAYPLGINIVFYAMTH